MTLPVVLWGGPHDGTEYSSEQVYLWGTCPTSLNVFDPHETDSYVTYYRARRISKGCEVFRVGRPS